MPLTPSELLAFGLIQSLQIEDHASCLGIIGEFVREVPARLGRSDALDAVTACMLATHKRLLRNEHQDRRIEPRLYGRALHMVSNALTDPQSWSTPDTLCATVLLHRIEVCVLLFITFAS